MNNKRHLIISCILTVFSCASNAGQKGASGPQSIDEFSSLATDNHVQQLTEVLQSGDIVLARDLLQSSSFIYGESQLNILLQFLQNDDASSLWPHILGVLPSFPQLGEREDIWDVLDHLLETSEYIPSLRPPVLKCIARLGTIEGFQVLRDLYISSSSEKERMLIIRLLNRYQRDSIAKVFHGLDENRYTELDEFQSNISEQEITAREHPKLSNIETALALIDLHSSDDMIRFRSIHRLKNAMPSPEVLRQLKDAFDIEKSLKNKGELLVAIAMLETEEGSSKYLKSLLDETLDEELRPLIQHLIAFPPTLR